MNHLWLENTRTAHASLPLHAYTHNEESKSDHIDFVSGLALGDLEHHKRTAEDIRFWNQFIGYYRRVRVGRAHVMLPVSPEGEGFLCVSLRRALADVKGSSEDELATCLSEVQARIARETAAAN